jgi:hypothetical protein
MNDKEHQEQAAFFEWFSAAYPHVLAFAIPNGGHRHIAVARKLKSEGVKPGVPDIFIADGKPGIFLEMKVKPNKLTEKQAEMLKTLKSKGYKTAVCYSFEEAKQAAEYYLMGKS